MKLKNIFLNFQIYQIFDGVRDRTSNLMTGKLARILFAMAPCHWAVRFVSHFQTQILCNNDVTSF